MLRELPVDAKVECQDGDVGRVTDIVVDPATRAVTSIVVREDDLAGREFLVPLDRVADSSRERVRLSCTKAELVAFPEFTTTRYVAASSPEAQPVIAQWQLDMYTYSYGYEPIYMPTVSPDEQVPIIEDHVPAGKMAIDRGSRIVSSDDQDVGEVTAFVVGLDGAISHFVLHLGEGPDAREVTLPLTSIDHRTDNGARLRLTRADVEALPAVPAGGKFSDIEGGPDASRLISIVFDSVEQGEAALKVARAKENQLDVEAAAVVRKNADGKINSHETHDITGGKGAVAGAVVGGVLSLVVGPLGFVASSAVGAAAGGVVGHVVDLGVPDRYVRDLGRALRAGSSALVVLLPQHAEAALLEKMAPLGGQVLRLQLTDEMIASLSHPPSQG
jgi:uncharacterized membrane protein